MSKEKNTNNIENKAHKTVRSIVLVIMLLLLVAGASTYCIKTGIISLPGTTPFADIEMEDEQKDINESIISALKVNNSTDSNVEYINMFGYSTIKVRNGASVIPLQNPADNSVNFIYTITKPISEENVKTFSYTTEGEKQKAINDATEYISSNNVKFSNVMDGGYFYKNEKTNEKTKYAYDYAIKDTGKEIKVMKKEKELIYFTKGIAPGKSVDWDISKSLSYTCDVTFEVTTYDVTDSHQTTGSNIDVHIEFVE